MTDAYELWSKPAAEEMDMIVGWRQWADAGTVSSGLPQFLIDQTQAIRIGQIRPDGFYIFQVPGTHDLMRPLVKFNQGFPESLQTQQNEFYYTENNHHGLVIFLGDEPHLDVERYIGALLDVAHELKIKRIIGLGGVYGEVPYDKERIISCNYSLPNLKAQLEDMAVSLTDYQGGASIGSFLCRRAGDRGMDYIGMYAFVPAYDFSVLTQDAANSIRIETDSMAWMGVVQRINYMLKTDLDLAPLEKRSHRLVETVQSKIDELEKANPELGISEYLRRLSADFQEIPFSPLEDVWKDNLRELLNKFDAEEGEDAPED
jgi:proteasome assembly chaperone (PAC2) family protein